MGKGCKLGDMDSCTELGVAYHSGEGVPKDDKRAVALYERGCRAENAVACANLAAELIAGEVVRMDLVRARALSEKACNAGIDAGCFRFGMLLHDGQGWTRGRREGQRASEESVLDGTARSVHCD